MAFNFKNIERLCAVMYAVIPQIECCMTGLLREVKPQSHRIHHQKGSHNKFIFLNYDIIDLKVN